MAAIGVQGDAPVGTLAGRQVGLWMRRRQVADRCKQYTNGYDKHAAQADGQP